MTNTANAARVALATCAAFADLDVDDQLLLEPLRALGIEPAPAVWDDPGVDWASFDAVVIRSTWDYAERRDEFLHWVEETSRVTRVLNPISVVAWSSDKHYLNDLSVAGVPVVSTHFVEPGDEHWNFPTGFAEFVVKPAISAGSRDTMRYSHASHSAANAHVRRLLDAQRSVMIQPYLPSVDTVAETALLFFDGEYSHAIRKGPLLQVDVEGEKVEGLFIQEQIDPREPTPAQREVAQAAMAVVPRGPEQLLYARIDLIDDTHGNPVVLELELVEPSVFLVTDPSAATRFAEAIARNL